MARSSVELRPERPFVTRIWSRARHVATIPRHTLSRRGDTRPLASIELGDPAPLLMRLVRAPIELEPRGPVRRVLRLRRSR